MTAEDSDASATSETALESEAIDDVKRDDVKRRYLQALDRKRAGGSKAASGHGPNHSGAPTSNDKVQRTFRRRAGG